ncbi:hypothetical protein VPH35_021300 [Triticum aestivum]
MDELGEGMIMVVARSAMAAATSTSSLAPGPRHHELLIKGRISFILMSQDKQQKRRVHPLLARHRRPWGCASSPPLQRRGAGTSLQLLMCFNSIWSRAIDVLLLLL